MLEQLRKSGASIAIYLIFGLLIIIFVINFAPNAGQGKGGSGCMPGGSGVLTVGNNQVNQSSYHVAYAANKYAGRQKVYAALEMLIRRELLASEAADRGIRVTKGSVEEEMKKGNFFYAGFRIPDYSVDPMGNPQFITEHTFFDVDKDDGEKFFNTGKFKGWVNSLNVSVGAYYDEQVRSMQASLMYDLIVNGVRVSRDEVMQDYLLDNNTVGYDTVTFTPAAYRDAMRLADADVARFLESHDADVKKKYADEERTYKATKPAYKLRVIKIDVAKAEPKPVTPEKPVVPAPGSGSAAGSGAGSGSAAKAGAGSGSAVAQAGAGSGSAAKPAGGLTVAEVKPGDKPAEKKPEEKKPEGPKLPTADEAKAKLEAARAAIAGGKQKFADAAKTLSTDEATKWNGGLVGWKPVENAGLGDTAINDAVKAIKPGELTPVVVGESAVYLVTAEDKREGDLSYDQVKAEIAADLARDAWSKEAAKRGALTAFEESRKGSGKNLSDMFEKGVNADEEKRRIEQMINEQMGNQHGALEVPEKDTKASWQAGDGQTAGAGAGSAGSAAPAAGSGSATAPAAGSGSAAGAGSGSAGTTPAKTPPAKAALEPSKDVLPQFGDLKKPKVVPYNRIKRDKDMPGLEGIDNAGTVLFDELAEGQLGKQVYETPDGFVLVQVKEKRKAGVDDFEKVADEQIAKLRSTRGRYAVESFLKTKCEALAKDGKIKPHPDLVHESDDSGKVLPQVYKPCMSFR